MGNDLEDWAKNDVEKVKKWRQKDGSSLSITEKMEYSFWGLAILALVWMMVSMVYPGVGPGKPVSGILWLSSSIGGMGLFGGLAFVLRQLPEVDP